MKVDLRELFCLRQKESITAKAPRSQRFAKKDSHAENGENAEEWQRIKGKTKP
jgi:hypothetical protein